MKYFEITIKFYAPISVSHTKVDDQIFEWMDKMKWTIDHVSTHEIRKGKNVKPQLLGSDLDATKDDEKPEG